MNSALYLGRVRHRRFYPKKHEFTAGLFMVLLDLSELQTVFRRRLLWSTKRFALCRFRRQDYLGDARTPLDVAVRDLVQEETGHRPLGPIRLLTNLRTLGYRQNPVSFYYCYGTDGSQVEAIISEITNTPWGEVHRYVHDVRDAHKGGGALRFDLHKAFHISPFMGMNQDYQWSFTPPTEHLAVHMSTIEAGTARFDATLTLKRHGITAAKLAFVLLRYPLITWRIAFGIYFNALRLRMKGCPFHPHPRFLTEGAGLP